MRKFGGLLAFLIVLGLIPGTSAYGMPSAAGSFLTQRVSSLQGLVKQISANKLVSARYTQHFRTNRTALLSYFQDNLKLSTLRKPTVTTVYYVNKAGKIMKGKRLLPTGTVVFVTRSGEPVLDGRCGNPLRAFLPLPAKDNKIASAGHKAVGSTSKRSAASASELTKPNNPVQSAQASSNAGQSPATNNTAIEKVLGNVPAEVATLPLATAPAVAAEAMAPAVVTATPAVAPPTVEAIATAPTAAIPPVIAAGSHFNFLGPLALLGGIGAAISVGGHDSHPAPVPEPEPVPEPSSLIALATGIAAFAGYTFKGRRY